jgi:amino acid transporter
MSTTILIFFIVNILIAIGVMVLATLLARDARRKGNSRNIAILIFVATIVFLPAGIGCYFLLRNNAPPPGNNQEIMEGSSR